MDAQMQSSTKSPTSYQEWDYYVVNGIVPIIEGEEENAQAATIAAFLQVGTIPQLPEEGVDWTGFFTGGVPFNEIDNTIKNNLARIGLVDYYPTYDTINDSLVAQVGKA
jgi:hypothetical protein